MKFEAGMIDPSDWVEKRIINEVIIERQRVSREQMLAAVCDKPWIRALLREHDGKIVVEDRNDLSDAIGLPGLDLAVNIELTFIEGDIIFVPVEDSSDWERITIQKIKGLPCAYDAMVDLKKRLFAHRAKF